MKHSKRTQKVFLFGAGFHGQTCIDVIEKQGKYKIIGIIDSLKEIGSFVDGYEVLGRMENLQDLIKTYKTKAGFIGIGDNWIRKRISEEIHEQEPSFEFVNIIHPSAIFGKNVTLGKGILLGADTFISSSCKLGDFCFLHHKAMLGLHNHMADFSSVSLGSLTGGRVSIGNYSAITLRVVVRDRVNIGKNSIVGMGSVVVKDVPELVISFGNPAKIIRSRKAGDTYLQ